MKDIKIQNAIIEAATISYGDRGFLDVWITMDYGGSGQGFGGYTLYLPKSFSHHTIESPAGHHIFRCMEIAGVTNWDKMKGKSVRVLTENGLIKAIGHIVKDDWFNPSEDYAQLNKGK